ncbi:MAG: redoxin domain-containing protein [Candidatus Sungbacteria bacterium]|nr:redoxin domain-containing protein [Candidatus Sungbacteria bacterium]
MSNKLLIGGVIVIAGGLLPLGKFSGTSAPANGTAFVKNSVSANSAQAHPAPDFALQKLGGGTISLAEFKGKKPVVVDFWASWCPNCRRDMPKLNDFYEKYKDKIEVIGVNLQEKESTVQNFINSRNIGFPIALDPSGQASNAFGIQYTNTHFLVDTNGNLVRTIPGNISEADTVSLIEQTASESQSSLPDKKPCELASAEGGEGAGVCKNETL